MTPTRSAALPAIGADFMGGTYAGVCTNPDGGLYLLVLLPNEPAEDLNWSSAVTWAQGLQADLPNRVEGSLLFANLKPMFAPRFHWLSEQYSRYDAWVQYFDDGDQINGYKSYEAPARAVRRFSIDSFNQFLSEVAA